MGATLSFLLLYFIKSLLLLHKAFATQNWERLERTSLAQSHKSSLETFATKAQALAWARKVEAEMDARRFNDTLGLANITLKEHIDWYFEKIGVAHPIGKNKAAVLRTWQRDRGDVSVADITSDHLTDFVRKRRKAGASGVTTSIDLTSLVNRTCSACEAGTANTLERRERTAMLPPDVYAINQALLPGLLASPILKSMNMTAPVLLMTFPPRSDVSQVLARYAQTPYKQWITTTKLQYVRIRTENWLA
jgi:hypothetical protein